MNSLRFDYAISHRYRPTHRQRVMLILAAVSTVIAVGFWVRAASQLDRTQAQLEAQQTAMHARQKETADHAPDASEAIKSALHVLALPLPTLLRALQPPSDIGGNIGIVAFELLPISQSAANVARTSGRRPDTQRIRLTAHADTLQPAAHYLAYLSSLPGMTDAQLMRHEFVSESGTHYVLFVIDLSWRHEAR